MTFDRATGRRFTHADLRLPQVCNTVWTLFWRMDQSRQTPFEAPQPFTGQDILAWCTLSSVSLLGWEIDALMEMDGARRSALLECRALAEKPEGLRRTVSFKDTSAIERMFDGFGDVVEC